MDGVEQLLLLERFPEALNTPDRLMRSRVRGSLRVVIPSVNFGVTGERCIMVVMALSSPWILASIAKIFYPEISIQHILHIDFIL